MKWQKRNAGQYEEDDVLCHPRAGGEGTAWQNLPVMQEEPHGTPGLGAGSGNGETSECTPKSSQAELDESGKVWQRPGHSEATAGEGLAPGEHRELGHCWGGQGKHRITTLLVFLFQSSARMRNPSQSQLPAQVHGSQQRWEPPALGHAGI